MGLFYNALKPTRGSSLAEERTVAMSVPVCLSVCLSACTPQYPHVQTLPHFHRTWDVTFGRRSVLLSQRCDTPYTSGFVNGAIFAHNRPRDGERLLRVTQQEQHRIGAKSDVNDCLVVNSYLFWRLRFNSDG